MSEEYDQIWKTIRASLNITASEFVPKLYETLTKQDGYSPKDARDKIKRDATNIWKADTIDRHIPEEAKQMIKVTAGQQKGKTKTEIEKDEVTNKDSAGFNPAQYQPSSAMEEFRKQHGTVEQEQEQQSPEQEQEEPDNTIYDKAFVDRLVKENAQLVTQFSFNYDLEVKDQVLPLKVTVYPEQKYGHVRLRKEKEKAK